MKRTAIAINLILIPTLSFAQVGGTANAPKPAEATYTYLVYSTADIKKVGQDKKDRVFGALSKMNCRSIKLGDPSRIGPSSPSYEIGLTATEAHTSSIYGFTVSSENCSIVKSPLKCPAEKTTKWLSPDAKDYSVCINVEKTKETDSGGTL
jgi:hypothetical protein